MKRVRIISILTAVVLLTACCVIPASAALPPQIYLFGDVNFDDELTVSDATDVQQAAAEMVEFDIHKSKTADINHDGFVTVADATLIQMVAAEMEIPEGCGGYIDLSINIYSIEADYLSGKMPFGTPITFTAHDYYSNQDISYEFSVDDTVVQSGSSQIFTYAFDKAGTYKVTAKAVNRWGIPSSKTIEYTVLDSIDLSQPRIIDSKLNSYYNSSDDYGYKWDVQAQGGAMPYTYCYTINEITGFDEWDVSHFESFKSYKDTDWELRYNDSGRAYLYKEFTQDNYANIPYDMIAGGWCYLTVTAKDANGNLAEPVTIEEGINIIG